MQVWRVEDKECRGPYCDWMGKSKTIREMIEEHNEDSKDHPTCFDDKRIKISFKDVYGGCFNLEGYSALSVSGFKTYDDLKRWFFPYMEELIDNEFSINIYEVPEKYVNIFAHQVLFVYDHATFVDFVEYTP